MELGERYHQHAEGSELRGEGLGVGRIKTFKKKILFLADMLELGSNSIKLHQGLKSVIEESNIDEIYTIGSKMKYLHNNFDQTKLVAKHFNNRN